MSCAILCHACDKYSWILDEFISRASLWFPSFCVSTEEYELDIEESSLISNITVGCGSWSERLLRTIEQIEATDILYLQEDFLIEFVDRETLVKAYKFHYERGADITKLGHNHEFKTCPTAYKINGFDVNIQLTKDTYTVSHQPIAIFNKEFLRKTLIGKQFGPSEHELITSKEFNPLVYCVGQSYCPNRSDIISYVHAIRKGELTPEAKSLGISWSH